jgi:hypothetical protein
VLVPLLHLELPKQNTTRRLSFALRATQPIFGATSSYELYAEAAIRVFASMLFRANDRTKNLLVIITHKASLHEQLALRAITTKHAFAEACRYPFGLFLAVLSTTNIS